MRPPGRELHELRQRQHHAERVARGGPDILRGEWDEAEGRVPFRSRGPLLLHALKTLVRPTSLKEFAERLGISAEMLRRLRCDGLNVWEADQFACVFGYHPAEIWPRRSRSRQGFGDGPRLPGGR